MHKGSSKLLTGIVWGLVCHAGLAIELDPTWGDRGRVTTSAVSSEPFAIGVQSDGKVIVGVTDSRLIRFDRSGRVDAAFGSEGILTLPAGASYGAMAIQPDDKIVLAGWVHDGAYFHAHALRLLSDGTLDDSFGVGGSVTTSFPGINTYGSAIALQPDGKVVLAGGSGVPLPPTAGDFTAIRLDDRGALDMSFGSGGLATLDMGGITQEIARSVAIASSGRIVIGGDTDTATGSLCAIGALRADGQPDQSFGVDGRRFVSISQFDACPDLAVTPEGKVVATLRSWPAIGVYAVRLASDGSPDPTFGSSGVAKIGIEGEAVKIAVDRWGRVVVAGSYAADFLVARFLPDGRPDPAVGPGGWTQPDLGGGPPHYQANATALAVQDNGAILVGGGSTVVVISLLAIVRYVGEVAAVPSLSIVSTGLLAVLLGLAGLFAIRRWV